MGERQVASARQDKSFRGPGSYRKDGTSRQQQLALMDEGLNPRLVSGLGDCLRVLMSGSSIDQYPGRMKQPHRHAGDVYLKDPLGRLSG